MMSVSINPESPVKTAVQTLVDGTSISAAQSEQAVLAIMRGDTPPELMGAFLTALRCRGENADILLGVAKAMRAHMQPIELGKDLMDTCGTGGDGANTVNISTMVAFVLAASGVKIAKHGNRSVSSKSGSADVLEACGVQLQLNEEQLQRCMQKVGMAFLYAPSHHPAMRHAGPIRKSLGFRTIFNLAGPLTNPAGATKQLLGVFDPAWLQPMAEVLRALGSESVWVVHGDGGLDELSISGPTQVARLFEHQIHLETVHPNDLGLNVHPLTALVGGDAKHNATIMKEVLKGAGPDAVRDAVALNAGAGLVIHGTHTTLQEGVQAALATLHSKKAYAKLEELIQNTQS